jgi:hypothetical protein
MHAALSQQQQQNHMYLLFPCMSVWCYTLSSMSRAFKAALLLSLLQRTACLAMAPSHLTTIGACLHPLVAGELMRSGPCAKDFKLTTV